MKIHLPSRSGLTLIELSVTAGLVGVLGLIIYSLLNIGMVLGAKNTAVNTAHQQARVAMLKMLQDLHSSVSLPLLMDVSGTQAAGISFQQWSMGPFKVVADTADLPGSQNFVMIALPAPTSPLPVASQRLIIPTHQIEGDIKTNGVSGTWNNLRIELENIAAPSPAPSPAGTKLPVQIKGTASTVGDIVCYITDHCRYSVVSDPAAPAQYKLQWTNTQGTRDIVNDVTNPRPFSIPTTPAGALYYRFVAAIDLSTSDPKYSNRGYKSANILLNGQVPFKARLTTYQ